MIIREATTKELSTVFAMAVVMHSESRRYRSFKLSARKLLILMITLQSHIARDRVILVAESKGKLIGMFWGRLSSYFFSDQEFAADILLYVAPKYRKGFVAYKLVKAFEAWSKDLGVDIVQVGISTGTDNEGYAEFYERLGYSRTGIVLSKEI